jgi:hypothetical protein
MVHATNTNHFGKQQTNGDGKPRSNFLPRKEWNKLRQEKKDQLIEKRCQD